MASIYDDNLQLRRIDPENWLKFDGPRLMGLQKDERTWLERFMGIELSESIPAEVQAMFETSRGAMIYSYFYYPPATPGMEHCYRTLELAVRIRANDPMGKQTYAKNIEKLGEDGVIDTDTEKRLTAARELRNMACHPNGRSLADPGMAFNQLRTTAELIDGIFTE